MNAENGRDARKLQFPCLFWEPTLDAIILPMEIGIGAVLKQGNSRVLKVGMIVPCMASRWCIGGEEWDWIVPPREFKITLQNVEGPLSRPGGLGVDTERGADS